ncbi:MAG: 3-hydroxyacyl-ACP dehydratase FabZ [Victivallales bacterium]|nr:3-hydroxyacyl-ACP dehydratase FabZ [Victivallales bacterium]MCF7888680.1 3-hydroxyacyl-ACP dehydratase FabZ [Victivallales bacterium]
MDNTIYCIEGIKEKIPYKYPMLLVDRVWKEDDGSVCGLKNVTVTEDFFNGHFPNQPIMPGVLQVEAAQQVASIAVRDTLDPENNLDIYIKSMRKVKFRNPVLPGDRLFISVKIRKIESNEAEIEFLNKSHSGVCTQGFIVLSTRPRKYHIKKPELFQDYNRTDNIEMDLNTLKKYMPHRYPFLFIDYIHSIKDNQITAVKNVTYNDPIMHTYSPEYSVLPATIQSEIIAQAGCAPTLARPDNGGKIALFGSIQKAEFYHPIHPGDKLIIKLDLPQKLSRFGKGSGTIYVEDKKVAYGEILFVVSDGGM